METINSVPLYWYVFYKDQLLLQKKTDGYAIPCTIEAPVTVARSLPVEMQDGTMAMAAFTDAPLVETDVYLPMGLRASYDHIDRYFYDQAGKAYEIVYWGSAQPVLSCLRNADGVERTDREEMSGLRKRDISGSIARHSCLDPERRRNPLGACT